MKLSQISENCKPQFSALATMRLAKAIQLVQQGKLEEAAKIAVSVAADILG